MPITIIRVQKETIRGIMSGNFFIDGKYTNKQIKSINKVKSKSTKNAGEVTNGDSVNIFSDINSYKKDKTVKTANSNLFDYIENLIGMENFLVLIDSNGDGKISEKEANAIAKLDKNSALDSNDIDSFVKSIKEIKQGKSTVTKNNQTVEYTYQTDSNGNLVKKTSVKKDAKTNDVLALYTYDSKGNVATKNDKIKNVTIEYNYDRSGKKTGSKTYANNKKKTLKYEDTYDDNGRIATRKRRISPNTGLKESSFSVYTYDKNGLRTGEKRYKGSNTKGKLIANYKYNYNKKGILTSRFNSLTSITKNYEYDSEGNIAKATFTNKKGKKLFSFQYNKDGTYSNMSMGNYVYTYVYDNGVRTGSKKYSKKSIGDDGKPKAGASVLAEYEFEDGEIAKKTDKETKTKTYYSGGRPSAKEEGEYTYVYKYDSSGNKTTKVYKTSDCENGVPKSGAKVVSDDGLIGVLGEKIVENAAKLISKKKNTSFRRGKGKGGLCDDFCTSILDKTLSKDQQASWYKSTTSGDKMWGPKLWKKAAKSGSVVYWGGFDKHHDKGYNKKYGSKFSKSTSTIKKGDLAFVNGRHTIFVEKVKNGYIYAVDSGGTGVVRRRKYKLSCVNVVYRATK